MDNKKFFKINNKKNHSNPKRYDLKPKKLSHKKDDRRKNIRKRKELKEIKEVNSKIMTNQAYHRESKRPSNKAKKENQKIHLKILKDHKTIKNETLANATLKKKTLETNEKKLLNFCADYDSIKNKICESNYISSKNKHKPQRNLLLEKQIKKLSKSLLSDLNSSSDKNEKSSESLLNITKTISKNKYDISQSKLKIVKKIKCKYNKNFYLCKQLKTDVKCFLKIFKEKSLKNFDNLEKFQVNLPFIL